MSRLRDIIQEIADIRARRRFGSAMAELTSRLFTLAVAFKSHDRSQTELIRYFPVALIACMEGYFRMVIRDLVNSGDPFLANAERISSTIKLDFSIIRAVHGRQITIGELVAHSVPISRLAHIEETVSSLLGTSFFNKLRSTTDRWAHEVRGEPPKPILDNPETVFSNIQKTFDLRHVICHEIASAYEITTAEIESCFESCVAFLRAADECISETLHPGPLLTQADMNIAAYNSLQEAEAQLLTVITTLKTNEKVNQVNTKWREYCEAWIALKVGERNEGGSMWPTLYSSLKQSMVERWTNDLKDYQRNGTMID